MNLKFFRRFLEPFYVKSWVLSNYNHFYFASIDNIICNTLLFITLKIHSLTYGCRKIVISTLPVVQSIKNSIVLSTTYSMSQSVTYSYVYIRIHERPILAVCSNNAHQTKLWGRNFIHGSKIMLLKQQSFNLYFYLFKKSNAKLDTILFMICCHQWSAL